MDFHSEILLRRSRDATAIAALTWHYNGTCVLPDGEVKKLRRAWQTAGHGTSNTPISPSAYRRPTSSRKSFKSSSTTRSSRPSRLSLPPAGRPWRRTETRRSSTPPRSTPPPLPPLQPLRQGRDWARARVWRPLVAMEMLLWRGQERRTFKTTPGLAVTTS